MKGFAVYLLLSMIPTVTFGETPESIIGTWQFDVVRTMTEHMDRIAEDRPEISETDEFKQAKASFARNAETVNAQVQLTFTEDTMTSKSSDIGAISGSYKLIGGNAGLMVIQITDDKGQEFVNNIWLVEGGIAIETTDCQTYPEQCAQQRTRQRRGPVIDSSGSHVIITEGQDLSGATYSPLPGNPSKHPQRVYFTRVDPE